MAWFVDSEKESSITCGPRKTMTAHHIMGCEMVQVGAAFPGKRNMVSGQYQELEIRRVSKRILFLELVLVEHDGSVSRKAKYGVRISVGTPLLEGLLS